MPTPGASSWPRRGSLDDVPASIAGYRVDAVLGQGSTGVVLRVFDEALDRAVALKLLAEGLDDEARARFLVEARAAGRVVHPNVVQVYAVGTYEGRAYIVQELVDGWPLSALLEVRGVLSPSAVIDLGIQAAGGLGRAAEVGVVHRDVKPQNLLVTEAGLVKLADFGVAKIVHAPTGLTDTGTTLGTPHYMSPEQGLGQEVDARSDQYALGATLYHLVTGRAPFDADNALAVLLKHVQEPLVPVRALAPECPVALAAVIERMLAKDRTARFDTFDAVIEALEAANEAPEDAEPADPLEVHAELRRGITGFTATDAPSPREDRIDARGERRVPEPEVGARTAELTHDLALRWGTAEARALAAALVVAVAVVVMAARSDRERDRPRVSRTVAPPADVAWARAPVEAAASVQKMPAPMEPASERREEEPPQPASERREEEAPRPVRREGVRRVDAPAAEPTVSVLVAKLERGDVRAQVSAARALGALGDQTALMPLVHALERAPREGVRIAAAEALGALGDLRAIEHLERAASPGTAEPVRRAAREALGRLFRVEAED